MVTWFVGRGVFVEEHRPGIAVAGGKQQNPLTALRQSKSSRIDDTIGPREPAGFKLVREPGHRSAAVKREHEWNVFKQQPLNRIWRCVQQPEHVAHQARSAAANARRGSSLAEILAGKTGGDNVDRRKLFQIGDVADERSRLLKPQLAAACA